MRYHRKKLLINCDRNNFIYNSNMRFFLLVLLFILGQGTFIYANDKYTGHVNHTYKNGNKYVGAVKDGLPNGWGTLTYPLGDKYVGEWKNGRYHGQGTFTSSNIKYEGEWKDGLKSGWGILSHPNGDRFEGNWERGRRHGTGVMFYANGDKKEGEWKNGSLTERPEPMTKEEIAEDDLNQAKLNCKEIGFKEGTEAFGECVLDLTE